MMWHDGEHPTHHHEVLEATLVNVVCQVFSTCSFFLGSGLLPSILESFYLKLTKKYLLWLRLKMRNESKLSNYSCFSSFSFLILVF
jgi:hypothetical protein